MEEQLVYFPDNEMTTNDSDLANAESQTTSRRYPSRESR